jgi:small subunit ribosomal protein S20
VPGTKSAKKQMRQSRRRAAHNRTQRSQLRTALKKVRAAGSGAAGSGAEAAKAYADATTLLDRAAQKRLIHPNAAARQKSRLARAARTKN